jgi:hypothetical protein
MQALPHQSGRRQGILQCYVRTAPALAGIFERVVGSGAVIATSVQPLQAAEAVRRLVLILGMHGAALGALEADCIRCIVTTIVTIVKCVARRLK